MQTRRWWTPSLPGLGALVLLSGFIVAERAGLAQPPQKRVPTVETVPCTAIMSIVGKDNYASYCATCHGMDARGDGPAAPAMKKLVPDLRMIASRHGGKFDRIDVETMIEGTNRTLAHGSTDMPIWGEAFRYPRNGSSKEQATLRIKNLVTYLESIQVK